MSDTDTQTSPTLADILATPEGQVAFAAVSIANTLPHLMTGESKRMFAFNAISDGLPDLDRYEVYFLIELAVKSLKES
jgi:hypothetical protein